MSIYTVNGSPVKCGNKWLTNGGTPSSELPPYDSTDAGKALVVNDDGDGVEWQDVGSSGVVDQHYDSTSSNAQSGTAVAEALQTVTDELPPITGNAGKVLKVNAGETGVEWATESGGATYTAGNGIDIVGTTISADTSVLATKTDLSGKQDTLTAGNNITISNNVISATDTTYTAGDAIEIDNNEISVAYDSDTLELQQQSVTHNYDVNSVVVDGFYGLYGATPQDIVSQLRTVSVTVHIPANTFYVWYTGGQDAVVLFKTNDSDFASTSTYCATPLSYTQDQSTSKYWLDEQDVVITALVGNATCNYFSFGLLNGQYLSSDTWRCDTPTLANPVQFSYTSASGVDLLAVKNPLPASTSSDVNKVLKVNASGTPEWGAGSGGTQVQSDWTEDDNTEPSYIQHKPTTKPISAGTGISIVEYADNVRITNTVDPQVQADWAENDNSEPDYIKNKPGVKQIVAGANVTITEAQGQITISSTGAGGIPVQADWTQQDSAQPDYIKNKPSIPSAQVNADWTAASGVAQVLHKPTTKPIVAGTGIVITETANEIIISLA